MPRLEFRANRQSLSARFDRFEREYPARVIAEVMRPWAEGVITRIKRQTGNPRNRTGNMRRLATFRVIRSRALEVQFTTRARSRRGVNYGIVQEFGTNRAGINRNVRLKARGWMRRAATAEASKIRPMLERETRRQASRSGLT